jgi:uncharacterized membrane protein YgdD (TMEM256/DUF423 family)
MNKTLLLTGLILITFAVILGAFGAHSLKSLVAPEKVQSFETGVRYQMYIGLSFLPLSLFPQLKWKWFYRFTVLGSILFSISIYLLAIQEVLGVSLRFLGPVTPIGGLLIIIGFITLSIQVATFKSSDV